MVYPYTIVQLELYRLDDSYDLLVYDIVVKEKMSLLKCCDLKKWSVIKR